MRGLSKQMIGSVNFYKLTINFLSRTVGLLVTGSVLVCFTQLFGDPIQCDLVGRSVPFEILCVPSARGLGTVGLI